MQKKSVKLLTNLCKLSIIKNSVSGYTKKNINPVKSNYFGGRVMNKYICKEFEKALKIHLDSKDIVEIPVAYYQGNEGVERNRVFATIVDGRLICCFYYEEDNDCLFVKF